MYADGIPEDAGRQWTGEQRPQNCEIQTLRRLLKVSHSTVRVKNAPFHLGPFQLRVTSFNMRQVLATVSLLVCFFFSEKVPFHVHQHLCDAREKARKKKHV